MPLFIPPAGVTAAGTTGLVNVISASAPAALLCDYIDPKTGDIGTLFAAPSPVVAAVQLAFSLVNKSGASVQDAGHRFGQIRKNDDTALQRTKDEVARIMRPFIDRGDVATVDVQAINTRADLGVDDMDAVLVSFEDLIFGGRQTVTLGTQ